MMVDNIRYSDKDVLESRLKELGRFRAGFEKEKGVEICFKFIPSERFKDDELENINWDSLIKNMNAGTMSKADIECLESLKARYFRAIKEFDFRQAFGDLFYNSPFKLRRRK